MSKDWEKHLGEWQSQGFLTAEQSQKILQYEQSRSGGSRLIMALTILAVFSIGLGFISLIAANWDAIPSWLKLLVYFSLMAGQVAALWRWDEKPGHVREALHLLYILSIIAGIGLIAQVFHVPSDGWRGLVLWSALGFGLMLRARTWYPIVLWQATLFAALSAYVLSNHPYLQNMEKGLIVVAIFCIAASWRGRFEWPELPRRWMLWVGSSVVLLLVPWMMAVLPLKQDLLETPIRAAGVLALLWLAVLKKSLPRASFAAAVIVGLAFFGRWIICFQTFHEVQNGVEALLFFIQLTALGVIALQFHAHRIFDVLTLFMAIRLLTLFFTLFGSLFETGAGLILFGFVILGLLLVWYRYRQKFQDFVKGLVA